MNFFEFATVFSLTVLMPVTIVTQVLRYKRGKWASKGKGGEAMRVSELRAVIERAVEEANEPLRRRIEQLEAIVTGPDDDFRLPALAVPEADEERNEAAPRRVRTRA